MANTVLQIGLAVALLLFIVLLSSVLLRMFLSLIRLGPWACRHNWHWFRNFSIEHGIGLGTRRTTYLAVAGIRIDQCRTCGVFNPPEGRVVYEQWRRGGISVATRVLRRPAISTDATAQAAINEALAPAMAEARAADASRTPPPRWLERFGSSRLIQSRFGTALIALSLMTSMVFGFGCFAAAFDEHQSRADALELLTLTLLFFGVGMFFAAATDAGRSRPGPRRR